MKTFRISGLAGDTILAIPTIRAIAGTDPIRLYLHEGEQGNWHRKELLPLLEEQGIDARLYEGEPFEYNLDTFRHRTCLAQGHIPQYFADAFGVTIDDSKPFLDVTAPIPTHAIVVSRTHRYRNNRIDYSVLHKQDVLFVGLRAEWEDFNKVCPCVFYSTPDFLGAARAIAGCRVFVGNQCCQAAIAHGLGVPRIIEQSPISPNFQSGTLINSTAELEAACKPFRS